MEKWLKHFKNYWLEKDIDGTLSLFSEDVEYWENPFIRLSKNELRRVWLPILDWDDDIHLSYKIFSQAEVNSTVIWDLVYTENGAGKHSSGVYLIKLNDQGLCNYFFQSSENSAD